MPAVVKRCPACSVPCLVVDRGTVRVVHPCAFRTAEASGDLTFTCECGVVLQWHVDRPEPDVVR